MNLSVEVLKSELKVALANKASKTVIDDLRQGIAVLNKNLFHQKIMGSDPNNVFYNAK